MWPLWLCTAPAGQSLLACITVQYTVVIAYTVGTVFFFVCVRRFLIFIFYTNSAYIQYSTVLMYCIDRSVYSRRGFIIYYLLYTVNCRLFILINLFIYSMLILISIFWTVKSTSQLNLIYLYCDRYLIKRFNCYFIDNQRRYLIDTTHFASNIHRSKDFVVLTYNIAIHHSK